MGLKNYAAGVCVSLLIVGAVANPAFAQQSSSLSQQCESSFSKKGNALSGSSYSASVSVPGLKVGSAIKQMEGVAAQKGMDVITADAEGGSMLIEEPKSNTHKAIPFLVTAREENGAGRVEMSLKLQGLVFGSAEGIKTEMCGMLAQLSVGGASQQGAAKAGAAPAKIIKREAYMLVRELKREAEDGDTPLRARYMGKQFQVTGRSGSGGIRTPDGKYRLSFDVGDEKYLTLQHFLLCDMAPEQTAYTLSVRPREKLDLTGAFAAYSSIENTLILKDCRPSK